MARYLPIKLVQAQATAAEVTQYTVPAATIVILKQIVLTNTSVASVVFGLSLVPSGYTAGEQNRFFPDIALQPGIITLDLSTVMNTGDFISMKAATTALVNVFISGVLVS